MSIYNNSNTDSQDSQGFPQCNIYIWVRISLEAKYLFILLVASMSGVVLGGVVEVVDSNLARGKRISLEAKYLQHLSAQLIHYIPLYLSTV